MWGTAHGKIFPNITFCGNRDLTQAGIVKVAEVDQELVDCCLREETVPHNPFRMVMIGLVAAGVMDTIDSVANHACKVPLLILAKFEVVTVISGDARDYAFATPLFVGNGAARN